MKFFYKPVYITDWVDREIKHRRRVDVDSVEFKTLLSEMKSQIHYYSETSFEEFKKWFNGINSKSLKVFPFLMIFLQDSSRWHYVQDVLIHKSQRDPKLFDYALEACYSDHHFHGNWSIVQTSFINNKKVVISGWTKQRVAFWEELIKVEKNQQTFIVEKGQKGLGFKDLIDYSLLRESHSFYNTITLGLFSSGPAQLYLNEKEKFIEIFKAADIAKQEVLANGFIGSGLVYDLEEISELIYQLMGTYVRQPMKWKGVAKENKETFHAWVMSKELKNFFGELNQNHERSKYWRKFSSKINKVIVFDNKSKILMFFDEVVILEIIGTGAVYVYENSVFDNHYGVKVSEYEKEIEAGQKYNQSTKLTHSMFRRQELVYKNGWLTHTSDWQTKFDKYLKKSLHWEVNENELIRNRKVFHRS